MIAPAELLPIVAELEYFARARLAKAALPGGIALRDSRVDDVATDLGAYFLAALERATSTIAKDVAWSWDPDDAIAWAKEEAILEGVLEAWYLTLGADAFAGVSEQLAVDLAFDVSNDLVAEVLDQVALEVTRITEQTRTVLRNLVERAAAEGSSIETLTKEIRSTFTAWSTGRARTIALTETANAYNQASLAGYATTGLVEKVEVFDGPDCGWTHHEDPDLAHGSIRTLEEAKRHPIAHPNCQRAFGAVVAR